MSEFFIEPDPIDFKFENIRAVVDEDGSVKILNKELSSYNFDGLIPLTSSVILVNQIKTGMMFLPIGSSAGTLNTLLSFDFDDPEMTASPSSDYILYYLDDNREISSFRYSSSSQITVIYENWEEKLLGSTGWTLTQAGNAIFSNVAVRGRIEALEGDIGGWSIKDQSASQSGALYFNGSIGPGNIASGVYLTGFYTAYGIHTASWQNETDIHQPSKLFIVYGPGLDSSSPSNLIPQWSDPKTIFYVDGHGYFSLGDRLTFDANTSILRANSAIFSGSLVTTNFYSGSITGGLITGASVSGNNIYGASVVGGYIEGIDIIAANIRSSNTITSSSGNGIYLDGQGNVRFSGPGGTLTFSPEDGLYLEGYSSSSVTDAQVISLYSNIRTASTVLGAKILTASSVLNNAVVRLDSNLLSASNNLNAQIVEKINRGEAADDILNNGKSITGYNVQTGAMSTSGYIFDSGNFSASGISFGLDNLGFFRSPNFSINENQLVSILSASINNAVISGSSTLIDESILSAAGTTLVRSTTDNTLKISTSSRKYKENIIEINIDPSWIYSASLNIKRFNYKGDSIPQIGLIAEDILSIDEIKEIVNLNMNGDAESIQYDKIGLLLIPIIKNLIEKIETLENRVIQLESQLGG